MADNSTPEGFEQEENGSHHHYYVPEFHMVVSRCSELHSDLDALERFKDQQSTVTSQIMHVGAVIHDHRA